MQKYYKPSRLALIFVFIAIVLAVYMTTLYRLQLFDTDADANAYLARDVQTKKVTLTGNRGDLLDRNGKVLVSTRAAYNVTLSWKTLHERDDFNKIILDLVHSAVDNKIPYNDAFPVTAGAPFSYVSNMTTTQKKRLDEYLKRIYKIGPDISASDLIVKMKEHYGIDYTMNISDARLVIGVRYELELRELISMNDYIFASDIGIDYITLLEEKNFPGVNIETSAVRIYHTTYAAHLLGYIGSLGPTDYENVYKALGYSYNAQIGKDGAEKAFESELHGTDGWQTIKASTDGTILSEETVKDPLPGHNVFLSIDIGLQAAVEDSLAAKIDEINADTNREGKDRVTGGAAVVTDVNTGEVLAVASYPTYDPSTLSETIGDLMVNAAGPMYDRATMGVYSPGSTFKMVTALAGFKANAITAATTVNDTGIYMKYATNNPKTNFTPKCWIYGEAGVGHGPENVIGAIRDSCDYFFYWLGDTIGADAISSTAEDFGFGTATGIELPNKAGTVATPANRRKLLNDDWFAADNMMSAIGQDINGFTPVQLANYVATIANGGNHYALTMLHSIRSADFSKVLYQPQPKLLNTIKGSEFLPYIQQGMREVATKGTASDTFKDLKISVACKTGTVQSDLTMGNELLNNGVFVLYAPADHPKIAISIVVEKGTSGATIAAISKDIIKYYFQTKPEVGIVQDNQLQP